MSGISSGAALEPATRSFYQRALGKLNDAQIPFLVGGAYAFARYTGIERHTKDFDIFVRPSDVQRTLKVLESAGYQTDLTFPHWLGKAFHGDDFVDVIFSSGNGIARVDSEWFRRAVDETVLDLPVKLVPPEEMIWSKGFIMERERFDGADIAHLIHASHAELDWRHLIDRYADHWRVLFTHVVLFGFIYPAERHHIPAWVIEEMMERLDEESHGSAPGGKVCQGTILSRQQYLPDLGMWGYEDARLPPRGNMAPEEVAHWTAAIDQSR